MSEQFRIDGAQHKRGALKRAREIAMKALDRYGIEPVKVQYIGVSDHVSFRTETADGQRRLLKVYSSAASPRRLVSVFGWLQALKRAGLDGPVGIPGPDGSYVLEFDTEHEGRLYVTLTRWIEGPVRAKFTAELIRKMSALLAFMHDISVAYVPPIEAEFQTWGERSLRKAMNRLESCESSFLSHDELQFYRRVAAKIHKHIEQIHMTNQVCGIIHGDLSTTNAVLHDGELVPIGFGRCGFGCYLYDMARFLTGLHPRQRLQFVEGYSAKRKLQPGYAAFLESFFLLAIIENYSDRLADLADFSRLRAEQPYVQRLFQAYLDGTPFLYLL